MTTTTERLNTALTGRYRIERELGQGGMATVYLAHDVKHERDVALKVLRRDLATVLGPDRFLAEIRTTANLQHPHIVGLIDSGQVDGDVYYVMPYLTGESLRDRLRRENQLPVDDAVRIATEVAQALDYAHRQGIIHRDIKPENILLQDGQAMVADFGIALAATQAVGGRMTETGMSLGTPQYMSPEQALGERNLTPQSDQYALACVLYELLAGEPPFTGPTVQAIVARVMTAEPEPIAARRSSTPTAVVTALARALQKVPADRFKSCGEFAVSLRTPVLPAAHVTGTAARSSRVGQWAPWGLAAAIAIAWGASFLRDRNAPAAVPLDYAEFVIEPPPGGQIDIDREFAISPDGQRVAFAANDQGGVRRLFVRDVTSREVRAVPGTEGAISPFFSPDGHRLAMGDGSQLVVVDLRTGQRSSLTRTNPDGGIMRVWAGSWGADDTLYVTVSVDSGLQVMKIAAGGGSPAWVFADRSKSREVGSHTPGDLIAFTERLSTDSAEGRIGLLSLRTGETRWVGATGFEPRYRVNGELVYGVAAGDVVARPIDLRTATFTGPPRVLATGLRINPVPFVWSAATGAYVFQQAGSAQYSLVEVTADGVEREVTQGVGLAGPRYSPDGRRVAFVKGGSAGNTIAVFSIADSGQVQVTPPALQARFPSWHPNGRTLLFGGLFEGGEDIGLASVDGSTAAKRLLTLAQAQRQPVVTADGARLVFIDLRPDIGLYDVPFDSAGVPREVVAGAATTERHPTFSGNGRWMAYTSFGTGATEEVYISPYPGPGPRTVISAGGGVEPAFHPRDDTRLYYRSGTKLIEATLAYTPEIRVVSRRTLFDRPEYRPMNPGRNYDISPDGTRFMFVKGNKVDQLIVRVPQATR